MIMYITSFLIVLIYNCVWFKFYRQAYLDILLFKNEICESNCSDRMISILLLLFNLWGIFCLMGGIVCGI